MSNVIKVDKGSVAALAELILSGSASEEERGVFLRAIQTALGAGLMAHIQKMHSALERGISLYRKLDERYVSTIEKDLEEDILSTDEIVHERNSLERRMLNILELERKIMQGKTLFPEDTLSSEDRMVIRVMRSIKTEEQKQAFFHTIASFMKSENAFEPEPQYKEEQPDGLSDEQPCRG